MLPGFQASSLSGFPANNLMAYSSKDETPYNMIKIESFRN
jgi:hypothetical protein